MVDQIPAWLVFGYLVVALVMGTAARQGGTGGVADFVAGDRAFGPVVMYFVMGATFFSAFALLGTPQRIVAKGPDAFYILAFGSVCLVPLFFFGAKVRRIGARQGYVTQAELFAGRYQSRTVAGLMGLATLVTFLPYLVIQLKAAGIVMQAVTGWPPMLGGAVVYGVVVVYVAMGGVRGVGWTNVVQGVAMLVVVWLVGLWIPTRLFGGVEPMMDRVLAEFPAHLTLPGPPSSPTSALTYTSEILVSAVGACMFPHIFMKCFTARSARLVQLTVVLSSTFMFFLLPLMFLGYAALLLGGPTDDGVLLWLVRHPELGETTVVFGFVALAVLAASMSTGDALLHAGASVAIRDVAVGWLNRPLTEHQQTRAMRLAVVALGVSSWLLWWGLESAGANAPVTVVDLLLLAYAFIIQIVPLGILGLYWPRANRAAATWGLGVGLAAVLILFVTKLAAPPLHGLLNPLGLQIGIIAGVLNLGVVLLVSWRGVSMDREHLRRFELR